jgi:phage tail-like protein
MADAAAPAPAAGEAAATTGTWVDPYRAYNFKLEILGITEGHFTECSGMGIKVNTIAYREGGTAQVVHQLPGPVEYASITLRYGLTTSLDLWTWFMSAVKGKVERKNISIVMLDSDGSTPVARWDLVNAWPAEWWGAPLDAMGREVAIESLKLVFETLDRG